MTRPAKIGDSVDAVETPALLLDLDAFEDNVAAMAAAVRASPNVRLRPHAKAHRCADIAAIQLRAGAVGICCQKVGEAEALAANGVDDIIVTNEIVGRSKLERLATLARDHRIAVCVDDAGNVAELDDAARRVDVTLKVLVEIDVGGGRCGVPPGAAAVQLAQRIERAGNLTFGGLQAYHGPAQHMRSLAERREAVAAAAARTASTIEALSHEGLKCEIVGGGGTGTFEYERDSGIWNELQVGSYIFMDADYARNDNSLRAVPRFQQSLFVMSTAMSVAKRDHVILDAGLKAFSFDSGPPILADHPTAIYLKASDEHGVVSLGSERIELGQRIKLIPGHCDPTVNLFDWYICIRGDYVVDLWPITARGRSD